MVESGDAICMDPLSGVPGEAVHVEPPQPVEEEEPRCLHDGAGVVSPGQVLADVDLQGQVGEGIVEGYTDGVVCRSVWSECDSKQVEFFFITWELQQVFFLILEPDLKPFYYKLYNTDVE